MRRFAIVAVGMLGALGGCRQGGLYYIPAQMHYVEAKAPPPAGAPEAVRPDGRVAVPAPPGAVLVEAGPFTAEDAIRRLEDGNLRFVSEHRVRSVDTGRDIERRAALTAGQHPFAAVLTCGDSRVSPEILFDQTIGDLFVVRNAGNVAEPVAEGSLEYAVEHLKVPVIVVLGHEGCGAVQAVVGADGALPWNLGAIQREMAGLREFALEQEKAGQTSSGVIAAAVERNTMEQARALLAESPEIALAVGEGRLLVVPAIYALGTGKVDFRDALRPLATPAVSR